MFPFISGGYYSSVITGLNNIQGRVVYAKSNQPRFILPDGFDKNTMHVLAFIFDYFPLTKKNTGGFWVGGGFEIWNNEARNKKERITGKFTNYVATIGAGYAFYFSEHFYVNPWGAVHAITGGPGQVLIGGANYRVSKVLPELSVKFGLRI